jgi:hypothetical protein
MFMITITEDQECRKIDVTHHRATQRSIVLVLINLKVVLQ